MRLPVAVLLLLLLGACAHTTARQAPVETVPGVDLQRYAGTWYEQAHLPLFFQRNCVANTTARYGLRADGLIDVVNACHDARGNRIESTGVARTVDASNSRLQVRFAPAFLSFLPLAWGDYWIVALDPDYQWPIVGTPNRKYLWILSREPRIPETELAALVGRAQALGYDTSRLLRAGPRCEPPASCPQPSPKDSD